MPFTEAPPPPFASAAAAAAAVACAAAAAAVDTEAAVGTFPLDSSAEPADIAGVTGGYSSRAPPFPCRSLATAMVAVVAVLRWRSEWVRKYAFAQLQSLFEGQLRTWLQCTEKKLAARVR